MSLWNVIPLFTPLMMPVEMYIMIIVTLMTETLGLPQACLLYCKLSPGHSSNPRPECGCSLHHPRRSRSTTTKLNTVTPSVIKDSGIYYEPTKPNSSLDPSFDEQTFNTFKLTPHISLEQNPSLYTKYNSHHQRSNSSKAFGIQDTSDEREVEWSLKYKRQDSYFEKLVVETRELPLELYLDIDLDISDNNYKSQLEELKNVFENFQAAEKDLSECINLHIYIFSKYIDTTTKTNTNWGHKVEYDNLSTTQELTEIQNKCNRTNSIIKQSIYQVKNMYPPKEQSTEHETMYSADSKEDKKIQVHHEPAESKNNANTTDTNTASDMYTTLTTYPTDDVYIVTSTTDTSESKYTKQDDSKMIDSNDVTDTKNSDFTFTSPVYKDQMRLNPASDNTANVPTATVSTTALDDDENLKTNMTRGVLTEAELDIPSIETKELPNGTLLSVVGGYENIPNSDFIDDSIISLTTEKSIISNAGVNELMSDPVLLKTNIDKIVKSDLVEIHGSLYFLFGKKQIPARFIQQPDGDLKVAIEGFSLCDQIKEEDTSNFMNMLCNCLHLQN